MIHMQMMILFTKALLKSPAGEKNKKKQAGGEIRSDLQ